MTEGITKGSTIGGIMTIEEIREVIEKQVEYNKAITGHQDYGISLSDSAALYLLSEIDRLKKKIEDMKRKYIDELVG